jgi:O-antigen/teichoic acid export membrane protein
LFTRFPITSLLKTAIGSLGLKIAAAGIGLLNGVLLARMLGPAEFGVYSIVIAAVTLFGTLAALGLPPLVTREVAVHHAQGNWPLLKGLLATSQLWVLLASLLFVLVGGAFVLLDRLPSTLTTMGWVSVLVLIPLIALNLLRAAILRGLHWVVTADVPDLLLRPIAMLIMLGGVYVFAMQMNAGSALVIQMGAALLALAFGSWLLIRRLPEPVRRATAETTHFHWLRSSGVFLAITIVGLLEAQVPLYLLGHLAGPEQAGLYQATNQIVGVVVMGLVAINMPLQGRLAASWFRGDREGAQKLVSEAARLGTAVALASALVLIPFAELVLRIYGEEYTRAANALRLLVVGQFINAASGPCALVLAATGKQKFALYGFGLGLVVSVGLILLLVPQYGVAGAAMGAVMGLLVWNVLLVYWAWRLFGIRTLVNLKFI